MKNSKIIIDAINPALKSHGFKKKSSNWYLYKSEVVLVVNLQKSQYGNQFYINCAVLVKALLDLEFPQEEKCHIRFRLDSNGTDAPENRVKLLLDLENDSISDEDRKSELKKLITSYVLPHLEKCSTLSGITEMVNSEKFKGWAIRKNLKDLIAAT
ncbi:MAG: DUF4304 domain-containing protein [Pseudomonadota bacterium]